DSLAPIWLRDGGSWPIDGSLNYNTILKLDLLCQRQNKLDKIPYVQFFIAFYQN
ncbi:hypothetical protein DBR06_SOUSAS5510149, partial [Sousa chinensis]